MAPSHSPCFQLAAAGSVFTPRLSRAWAASGGAAFGAATNLAVGCVGSRARRRSTCCVGGCATQPGSGSACPHRFPAGTARSCRQLFVHRGRRVAQSHLGAVPELFMAASWPGLGSGGSPGSAVGVAAACERGWAIYSPRAGCGAGHELSVRHVISGRLARLGTPQRSAWLGQHFLI